MRLVALALAQHVHVALADGDVTSVLLQAADKVGVETSAGVLHWGHLLLHLLLLLRGSLLLRFSAMARATSEHGADTLVGDFRAGSEGHTGGHSGHQTTSHSAACLRLSLSWGVSLLSLLGWGLALDGLGSNGRAAAGA